MMPEPREPQSVVDLAEQALAAGDYASAEHFLREAARLHETESGPLSPYLANTLNNLGVVSEMQNNADEAENCYRKAYEIASATLPPDHPFVATSRKNLADLCAARGKPIDAASPRLEPPRPEPVVETPAQPRIVKPTIEPVKTPAKPAARPRPFPVTAFLLSGLLVAILATIRLWPVSTAAPPETPPASAPVQLEPPVVTEPTRAVNPQNGAERASAAAKPEPARSAATAASPALMTARVCRNLSITPSSNALDDWPCDPATGSIASGPLFFYTRLKTPRDTTIQHRWYHDGVLYQAVELPVRANQIKGFRTYSRYTIKDGGSGNWRVELRSSDGTLLHQEQFAVR
jgi:hypothetical protein